MKFNGIRSYTINEDRRLLKSECILTVNIAITDIDRKPQHYVELLDLLDHTVDEFISNTYEGIDKKIV